MSSQRSVLVLTLGKILNFHLISWCGDFVEMDSFGRVAGNSPEKFPHQIISWNVWASLRWSCLGYFSESAKLQQTNCFFLYSLQLSKVYSKHWEESIQNIHLIMYLRPQLVKSLVIVIYFFETEMRDAIIINYCIAALLGKAVAKL